MSPFSLHDLHRLQDEQRWFAEHDRLVLRLRRRQRHVRTTRPVAPVVPLRRPSAPPTEQHSDEVAERQAS